MKDLFSYDDIVLVPNLGTLERRGYSDTSTTFLGHKFELPVIPANMEDVISYQNAKQLTELDCFYIMHRFNGSTRGMMESYLHNPLKLLSVSVGVGEDSKKDLDVPVDPHFITIDVAHGHHLNVKGMIKFIRDTKPMSKLIAGNVCTADGYKYLCDLGVDAVKVGIGGGSICTTRYETGFHLPTAYSVLQCAETDMDVPIIADGGIKHRGDIAKALVLGADMVMCGRLFASCIDSPAKIQDGKKVYRGSTSYQAKGNDTHVEGKTIELEGELTYPKQLVKIREALSSAISYAGGKDLKCLPYVEWKRI